MNRPVAIPSEVFWREKSRHRAEISPTLVPVLAAVARANLIDPTARDWETQTVDCLLRLLVHAGLTPQAIAAQAVQPNAPRPTQSQPAPLAALMLS